MLAVSAKDFERFQAICERERCPFAVVGEATEEPHLTVTDSHFANTPVDMPLDVLLGKPPRMHRSVTREAELGDDFDPSQLDLDEAVGRVLSHPAVASKSFLITIGDRTITGLVARDQMVGPWQVPVADVAVTATSFDVYTGEAMAMGERTPLALLDAPASGRMAIGETSPTWLPRKSASCPTSSCRPTGCPRPATRVKTRACTTPSRLSAWSCAPSWASPSRSAKTPCR